MRRGNVRLKAQTVAILVMLTIQELLGNSINLFASFPNGQTYDSIAKFFKSLSDAGIETIAHRVLGVLIVGFAAGILGQTFMSLRLGRGRAFSVLGLIFALSVATGDILFVLSGYHNDSFSAQMAGSFLFAYASCFIVLYQTRSEACLRSA